MSEEQTPYAPDTPAETPATPAEETPKVDDKPLLDPDVLMKKVENLAKENKNLIRSQQAMANHVKAMVEAGVKQRLAELSQQKDEAIDLGDKEKVRAIEKQMQDAEQQAQVVNQPPPLDPAIQAFVEDNSSWFNKDPEMTEFAIAYNETYLKRHPGDLEASLAATLEKVKKAFPEKFESEKKTPPPSPVEGASRHTTGNKYSISRLTEEQKIVYEQLVKRHGVLKHEEYFKSLEEAGYLA